MAGPGGQRAGPERRRYVITGAGIAGVQRWLAGPAHQSPQDCEDHQSAENRVPISESSDVAACRRATSWSYVIAVIAAIALIAYLSVWGQRYGFDLKVYRSAVNSWRSGQNAYLRTFTQGLMPRHRCSAIPPSVRVMLWGLIVLTIAAPYWWFSHGLPSDISEAVLPVWTSVVLLVWSITAFVTWRKNPAPSPVPAGDRRPTVPAASARHRKPRVARLSPSGNVTP